ncbi:MAG: hypothetical protein NTX55_02700 [Candidatus Parcubacteria bacterium]|nr:hypothetical protein [Candidatus Parcubacteria bacterium]
MDTKTTNKSKSWRETMEVMRIFPKLENDIKKAEREYKKGYGLNLEDLLLKEGFVLPQKAKK